MHRKKRARKFVIGSGYWKANKKSETFFSKYWMPNTLRADPEKIVILNSGSPEINWGEIVQWINLPKNPQHGQVLTKKKIKVQFEGWSLAFIQGAFFAHACGCDYIFKEQDCLAFGPWVEKMYECCKGKQAVSGQLWKIPNQDYSIELSLMLFKHEYIMPFLSQLFADTGTADKVRPEKKFLTIKEKEPDLWGNLNFGYGGNRPFTVSDCFYIQKPRWDYKELKDIKTPIGSLVPDDEIDFLKKEGLL